MYSNEKLQNLKDKIYKTDHYATLKSFIARLDAAEKVCWILSRFVERGKHAADCRCDFCYALKKWRMETGKDLDLDQQRFAMRAKLQEELDTETE